MSGVVLRTVITGILPTFPSAHSLVASTFTQKSDLRQARKTAKSQATHFTKMFIRDQTTSQILPIAHCHYRFLTLGEIIEETMAPLILQRIQSKDWDSVRNRIERLEKYSTMVKIIRFILQREHDFPSDILKRLFEKKRKAMSEDIEKCLLNFVLIGDFVEQLCINVCCRGFNYPWSGSKVYHLPLSIFTVIIEEHRTLFYEVIGKNSSLVDDKLISEIEHSKQEFVCRRWEQYLGVTEFSGAGALKKEDKEQLISTQSICDLERESNSGLSYLWERTALCLNHRKPSDATVPLLHYVIRAGYPIIIVNLVSKIYPEQLHERDEEGRIPLHYALRKPRNMASDSPTYVELLLQREKHLLYEQRQLPPENEDTSTGYSHGALVADFQGKLPIAMYLENRYVFAQDKRIREHLQLLIHAAPEALTIQDKTSGLLPFMIPSIMRPVSGVSAEEQNNAKTSMSYSLLRQFPSALNIAIKP